jgi:uncharacterized protein YbjT (DUF2867 family)
MIFVLGSTGLAGSQLVPVLLKRGASVRVGVHAGRKSFIFGEEQVEHVPVDFADTASLHSAFSGCDALYLLTPFTVDQAPIEERIANIAADAGVRRIVKQSVIGVNNAHLSSTAEAHRRIEDHICHLDLEWTFLQPTPFMQDLVFHQGNAIRHEHRLYAIAGEEPVAYVDARDLAAVAAETLLSSAHSGMIYPVTGPQKLTHAQLAEKLSAHLKRDIGLEEIQASDARRQLSMAGFNENAIATLLALHPLAARGFAAFVVPVVEEVTGHPALSIDDFLEDYGEAFKSFVEPLIENHHGAPRTTSAPPPDSDAHP